MQTLKCVVLKYFIKQKKRMIKVDYCINLQDADLQKASGAQTCVNVVLV